MPSVCRAPLSRCTGRRQNSAGISCCRHTCLWRFPLFYKNVAVSTVAFKFYRAAPTRQLSRAANNASRSNEQLVTAGQVVLIAPRRRSLHATRNTAMAQRIHGTTDTSASRNGDESDSACARCDGIPSCLMSSTSCQGPKGVKGRV